MLNGCATGFSEEDYRERLSFELGVIERMKYPGYFLIVADFIQWAKSQGIPVGPGRGSGAGSLVAYSLTITDLDPIRFGLIFERFLNPDRVSMPDFDIDFCQDRRDEVIRYVQQRYGRDQVAQIITFGTLQARGVLRDVGRVLQMPYGQVDKLTKLVPQNPAAPVSLAAALASEPKLQAFRDEDPVVARAFDIAQRLEGLTRHASTHAAGIVIADRPLSELVPLYRDPKSDMPVTQFNMKWVEPAGLVKFDFLGLKTLTVLDAAVKLLKQRGIELDIGRIPLDDKKTYEMLGRGDVVGVFQVESQGMRRALVDMRADRFEDLIALVALYRPGPMANIPTYCSRKLGEEEIEYLHPDPRADPEGDLRRHHLPGAGAADRASRSPAIRWRKPTCCAAPWARRSSRRWTRSARGFSPARSSAASPRRPTEAIFDACAKFAEYGFNKSHSAPYAFITYQTAWMKANYPVEFLAASMTLDINNTDKLSEFRAEAQRLGIKVEAPNVNRSGATFEVSDGTIYYALAGLKGVGAQAVELIVDARKDGLFTSLADFAARVNPRAINKRVIESLAAAGAFDALDSNRARVFAGAEAILAACQRSHEAATMGQNDMFGGAADAPTIMLPQVEPWLPAERLRREYDAIGFFLSGHPLDDYATALETAAGAVLGGILPRGENRRDRGQGRRHRGVADGAAHQDRQQDGHHRAVRPDRPFRGGAVFRRPRAVPRHPRARRRRAAAARRRAAGRGRPRPRAACRAAGCRGGEDPEGPADIFARYQAAGVRSCGGCRCRKRRRKAVSARSRRRSRRPRAERRWRRVAGADARPRNRGRNEAPRPLQGLAADRRRDQGGVGRGGRADGVGAGVIRLFSLSQN